jgi:hypothetical protein
MPVPPSAATFAGALAARVADVRTGHLPLVTSDSACAQWLATHARIYYVDTNSCVLKLANSSMTTATSSPFSLGNLMHKKAPGQQPGQHFVDLEHELQTPGPLHPVAIPWPPIPGAAEPTASSRFLNIGHVGRVGPWPGTAPASNPHNPRRGRVQRLKNDLPACPPHGSMATGADVRPPISTGHKRPYAPFPVTRQAHPTQRNSQRRDYCFFEVDPVLDAFPLGGLWLAFPAALVD